MNDNEDRISYTLKDAEAGCKTLLAEKKDVVWHFHSSIDPRKQGRLYAESNFSADKDMLIYGLGLGYHIKSMLELMGTGQKLYVLETDPDIYQIFKQYGTAEIMQDNRLVMEVLDDMDKISAFLDTVPQNTKILYYNPSIKAVKNKFEFIRIWFNNYKLDLNSRISFKHMNENHIANKGLGCPNFLELFEDKLSGIPCIIVSSGPSLETSKEFIKKVKGKCAIISVGRNSRFFKQLGIEPTFFIEIDHQDLVAERFENTFFKCPMVFLSTVSSKLPAAYSGPKSIFYVRTHPLDKYVVEGGGSTVAATALELAVKLGFDPIGLVGQDLVFDGKKSHFDSEASHTNFKSMQKFICNDGEMRYTNKSFLRHRSSIERVVASSQGSRNIYNLTQKGIVINGTDFIDAELFLNKFSVSVEKIEDSIINSLI